MIYVAAALALAVGVTIGYMLVAALRRTAASPEQAARRQHIVVIGGVALCAAFMVFDAITTTSHRYVNLVIVALIAAGLVFDWARARRRSNL